MRARLDGECRHEVRIHAEFYLRGREVSTIAAYDTEFKKFVGAVANLPFVNCVKDIFTSVNCVKEIFENICFNCSYCVAIIES